MPILNGLSLRFVSVLMLLPVLATPACDSSADSTLEIRARETLTDPAGLAGLVLRVAERVFGAEDLSSRPVVRVPDTGELTIEAELVQDDQVVAAGEVSWTMHEDYEWQLDIFRRVEDPTEFCFGCRGAVALEILEDARASPEEMLWFTWSGAERGSNVVY